ncbi:MAG: cupin domain-containing protein [Alphaproteobacteria bacterium]|nr:MAG: cupin domain-containing protein [Alphaproteobacteria bacterium]
MEPAQIVAMLGLAPHPEGGWFRETWRGGTGPGDRAAGTAIYFLLEAHQRSHWHRVDATEIWHWYGGAVLELRIAGADAAPVQLLGPDLAAGQAPQRIVPAHAWQSARPLGGWVLVGCTVSPAFEFAGFELAPPGWSPQAGGD